MEYFEVQLRQQLHVGLPARQVTEVLSLNAQQICPISGVHPLLLGVINWRGKLTWSLNLSDFLRLKMESSGPSSEGLPTHREAVEALIITGDPQGPTAGRSLACIVSSLKGVVEVPQAQVQPMPSLFPEFLHQVFQGMTRLKTPLLLLEADRLLDMSHWQDATHA